MSACFQIVHWRPAWTSVSGIAWADDPALRCAGAIIVVLQVVSWDPNFGTTRSLRDPGLHHHWAHKPGNVKPRKPSR